MLTQFCHLYEAMFVPNVSGEPFDNEEIECGFVEVGNICLYRIQFLTYFPFPVSVWFDGCNNY